MLINLSAALTALRNAGLGYHLEQSTILTAIDRGVSHKFDLDNFDDVQRLAAFTAGLPDLSAPRTRGANFEGAQQ